MHWKWRENYITAIVLVVIALLCSRSLGYDKKHVLCNGKDYPGVYSRDISALRCCKEQLLVPPSGLNSLSFTLDEKLCIKQIMKNNSQSDDDLATYMWKIHTCQIKQRMGSQHKQIKYKILVDFLTQNYTTKNNVQNIIKNASTECPDGDKEFEEHTKIQKYLTCFYKNEEQICAKTWSNTTAFKKKAFPQSFYQLSNNSERIPGIWNQKFFTCNGKPTPRNWVMFITYKVNEEKTVKSCLDGIYEFRKMNNMNYAALKSNVNDANIDSDAFADNLITSLCFEACEMNPILLSNGTAKPTMDWKVDLDSALDKFYLALPAKVMKELKAYIIKQKLIVKVPLTALHLKNATGISLQEIEKQYSSFRNIDKVKSYCGYYFALGNLVHTSLKQHCNPGEIDVRRSLYSKSFGW